MNEQSIYDYVISEERKFETEEIRVGDNWTWNFRSHVQFIFHLKNSVFFTGSNAWTTMKRAFKNIMEPILNLSYWSEDIDVKDVVFYIEEDNGRVLSFLIKKYHDEVYVKTHDLDMMFDEITESDLDYGGALVQKGVDRPEILQLNTIAFCDQTDILGGPIAFKFYFSPDKLRGMSKYGWGADSNGATMSLEDVIDLAQSVKSTPGTLGAKKNQVPGKVIEVYIVRGNMPECYLNADSDSDVYVNQIQIIGYYTDEKGNKQGVTLYRKQEAEGNIKFHTAKKVYGRALGRGTGETLLHPQVWTNFLTIHKTNLLEAASKVPLQTDDENYTKRNQVQDMENLEITVVADGKTIRQIPTAAPANIQLIEKAVDEWYEQGQLAGSAFDPLLGKEASSGTTFRGQERVVAQGSGLHDRRRGQRAKFIESIYRDWIIPDIKKAILNGTSFLATLSVGEVQWISAQLAENYANRTQIDQILSGEKPTDSITLKRNFTGAFMKKGNKHLLEILAGEFKDIEIKIGINIAGKQKDLAGLSDKILSIFQTAFSNPVAFQQTLQIPGMAEALANILEYSGLNVPDFAALVTTMPQQMSPQTTATASAPVSPPSSASAPSALAALAQPSV